MRRVLLWVGALTSAVTLALATPVHAADVAAKPVAAEQAKKKKHRRGGKVRAAWPRSKKAKAPKNQLARWLAKQVGRRRARRGARIEAALALDRAGIDSASASAAVTSIAGTAIGSTAGPVGADREVISPVWGEYHTWPTSDAASWLLIAAGEGQLLFTSQPSE